MSLTYLGVNAFLFLSLGLISLLVDSLFYSLSKGRVFILLFSHSFPHDPYAFTLLIFMYLSDASLKISVCVRL